MQDISEDQRLIRLSMRRVLLLSLAYALAGNAFMYAAYYNRGIIEWNVPISLLLIAAFAAPIVRWFGNRHWYFPVFIFLFWIPFSVLIGYGLSVALPLRTDAPDSFDLLVVVYLMINVAVVLLGLAAGMLINGILAFVKRRER